MIINGDKLRAQTDGGARLLAHPLYFALHTGAIMQPDSLPHYK